MFTELTQSLSQIGLLQAPADKLAAEVTHDLETNFNKRAPLGEEDTAKEPQDHAAKTQVAHVDTELQWHHFDGVESFALCLSSTRQLAEAGKFEEACNGYQKIIYSTCIACSADAWSRIRAEMRIESEELMASWASSLSSR